MVITAYNSKVARNGPNIETRVCVADSYIIYVLLYVFDPIESTSVLRCFLWFQSI